MKGNLEAKFYNDILDATKKEIASIEKVTFEVDRNIDNPTNKYVIDCMGYYKESERNTKKSNKADTNSYNMVQTTNLKPTNERYTLQNFVV
jgi:chromosomal replication initiation ATPase DnaA